MRNFARAPFLLQTHAPDLPPVHGLAHRKRTFPTLGGVARNEEFTIKCLPELRHSIGCGRAESLKAYEEAVKLQRRKVALAAARGGVSVAGVAEVIQTSVPAKLLNNAAVLYMRAGRPEKALELLEEALQVCSQATC